MAQMLQAPIEGYEDAIVVPPLNANNFELKQTLINLVQSNQFTEGEAWTWLDKEPPHSILTWEDLGSKFINQFFPPSKTTYLRNEIINFLQKPNETFNEAWEHFKNLLRQCPHHGLSELHQLDTFYNALNPNDQDALDSAAGGKRYLEMAANVGRCLVSAAEEGSQLEGMFVWVLPRQQHKGVFGFGFSTRGALVVVVNTKGAFVCGFWQPPLGSVWLRLYRLGESLLYGLGNIWLRYTDAYSLAILNSRG
nr:hypothetical protein [Tanacetum cinerariifolium]